MEIIYLLTGLIVGALLGIGVTKYFKQKKQIIDVSNFEQDIKNLEKEVRGYKEKVIEDKGKTDQIAIDMKSSVADVNRIAEKISTNIVPSSLERATCPFFLDSSIFFPVGSSVFS